MAEPRQVLSCARCKKMVPVTRIAAGPDLQPRQGWAGICGEPIERSEYDPHHVGLAESAFLTVWSTLGQWHGSPVGAAN